MYFYFCKNTGSVSHFVLESESICVAANELCIFVRGSFGSRIFVCKLGGT